MNNESVGKKIVEALKKQAENMDMQDDLADEKQLDTVEVSNNIFANNDDNIFNDNNLVENDVFSDMQSMSQDIFGEQAKGLDMHESESKTFEMPTNISVLRKLISQLPSGVSRHTGAQIIKQTMEALGISMKSVLQDAQQVQENLKVSARECQGTIQEYKKQILLLEKQSQNYQKQYSALNDLISLFIQTTR